MAFWRRLLAGSDWAHLIRVLSPSFFDVVSARELSIRAAELARNWFDRKGYLDGVANLSRVLSRQDCEVGVEPSKPSRSVVPFRADPVACSAGPAVNDGDLLLRLFFLQIAASDTVFLDLRATRFCRAPEERGVTFHPLPLWTKWQPDFVAGIRQLYAGFYADDSKLFEAATRALGVSAANDVFIRAFGGAHKRASRYSLAEFRDTFHEVFVKCRDAKTPFHPDFITLGIMLATLYEHLETLGGTYDVQAAYWAVNDPPASRSEQNRSHEPS